MFRKHTLAAHSFLVSSHSHGHSGQLRHPFLRKIVGQSNENGYHSISMFSPKRPMHTPQAYQRLENELPSHLVQ